MKIESNVTYISMREVLSSSEVTEEDLIRISEDGWNPVSYDKKRGTAEFSRYSERKLGDTSNLHKVER